MEDRNFRGTLDELVQVDKIIHAFDKAAGHTTQAKKTAFAATTATDRQKLKKMTLQGETPNVPEQVGIVGHGSRKCVH